MMGWKRRAAVALLVSMPCMVFAQASSAPAAPLTKAELVGLIECSNHTPYDKLFDIVMGDAPEWLSKNAAESGLSTYVYDLDEPLDVFGKPRRQVMLYKQFVAVPLDDEDDALAVIERHGLKQVPIQATQQHYRFIDPVEGPMLSVFSLSSAPFAMLLGIEDGEDVSAPTRYAGCTPAAAGEDAFLEMAMQGDRMLLEMQRGMDDLFRNYADASEQPHEP